MFETETQRNSRIERAKYGDFPFWFIDNPDKFDLSELDDELQIEMIF